MDVCSSQSKKEQGALASFIHHYSRFSKKIQNDDNLSQVSLILNIHYIQSKHFAGKTRNIHVYHLIFVVNKTLLLVHLNQK